MHVIVATDGSQASLAGAHQFKWIADSREVTDVTVVAVVSPYAAAPFANELGSGRGPELAELSFVEEAGVAAAAVAAVFDDWGPRIHTEIRSGSPASAPAPSHCNRAWCRYRPPKCGPGCATTATRAGCSRQ